MTKKLNGAIILIVAVTLLAVIVGVVGGMRGGGDIDRFAPDNFAELRQPHGLDATTAHGQVSVEHIRHMSDYLYNRFPFSYKEMFAAEWIVEELLAMGYTWEHIEVQEFAFADVDFFPVPMHGASEIPDSVLMDSMALMMPIYFLLDETPFVNFNTRASRQSQNVILTIPGQSENTIIVGAHYDSVLYPGASDNASGTALLLESAQRMKTIDNYYTIVYVFFGAEEAGLIGVTYYVNSLTEQDHDNLLFMLNADVLLEGPDLFYMGGYYRDGQSGSNHITETWDEVARDVNAQLDVNLMPWPEGVFGPSDQLAFLPHGHTAMFMIGLDALQYWHDGATLEYMLGMARVLHSPRDDFHYINENWPGKMEQNMMVFSVFLEELLLAEYAVHTN